MENKDFSAESIRHRINAAESTSNFINEEKRKTSRFNLLKRLKLLISAKKNKGYLETLEKTPSSSKTEDVMEEVQEKL